MAYTPEHNRADKGGPEAGGVIHRQGKLLVTSFMGSFMSPWPSNLHSPPGNVAVMEIIPISFIPVNEPKEAAEGF